MLNCEIVKESHNGYFMPQAKLFELYAQKFFICLWGNGADISPIWGGCTLLSAVNFYTNGSV